MKVLAVLALAGTLLSACASGGGTSTAASSPAPVELAGTSWDLVSYPGPDGAQQPTAPQASVATLAFVEGGTLAGSTGCNSFSGSYQQSGSQLTIEPGATTAMGCPGPVADQETAVLAALGEVASFAVAQDNLVLRNNEGGELLVYRPGLASLAGTSWTATGINNGKEAVVSDDTTAAVTAQFGEDGSLTGSGGCNTYTASWEASGSDSLTISPVASTKKACAEDVMATEQAYFAALAAVSTYQITGNSLTLRDKDGATQVSFTIAES